MSASAPEHSRVGILTSTPHEGGPAVVRDLVSCVHCRYTWLFVAGSGRRRGYCCNCHGLVCGRPSCEATGCVHWRQQLDNMESGRPDSHKPILVAVPAGVPRG